MPGKQKNISNAGVKPIGNTSANGDIPKWSIAIVLAVTALIYSKALFNGFVFLDDEDYIFKNPYLRDCSWQGVKAIFTSFYASNYHPLTTLIYLFEYTWFGKDPFPYHLLDVLLHLLNTWLVFKFAEKLSGKKITALIVCALFAIHPMHVESVAWISELKDVLYTAFYLSAMLFYLRYLDNYKGKNYTIALLLFFISLLAKSAAVTLPLVLIIIDWYKGRKPGAKSIAEKIPFFLLSLVFGILNIYAQKADGPVDILFQVHGFFNGITLITSGITSYISRVVFPLSLCVKHYFPMENNGALPWLYYLSLPFVALIAWLVIRRSTLRKELIFGFSFFIAAISVMLQILTVGPTLISERYTYISYIGLFYIAGQWVADIALNKWRNAVLVVSIVIAVLFSAQTWYRIGFWKDTNVLYTDIIDKNPGIMDVNYDYLIRGNYRGLNGDPNGALEDYTQAISMNPNFTYEYSAYYCRGHIYDIMGNIQPAIADYTNAIQLKPSLAEAYNNRGWDYFQAGAPAKAIPDLDRAISLNGNYFEAYNNRGWVYYRSGDIKAALADFDKAIQLRPDFDKPYYNRSEIKSKNGDFAGAIEDYNSILKIHPDDNRTYFQRGVARLNIKDIPGACMDWDKAAQLGNADAARMKSQYCH